MSSVLYSAPNNKLKAYLVLHDGTNLLVCSGGNSGRAKKPRGGLHLPGGTAERYPPGLERRVALVTALRELGEETGIDMPIDPNEGNAQILQTAACGKDVYFVVIKLAGQTVADLVKGFKRPAVTNPFDEPFESVSAIPLANCETNPGFDAKYYTDWFAAGLSFAKKQGCLQ